MHVRALVLAVLALVAPACSGAQDEKAADGTFAFTTFKVPGGGDCRGIWAADAAGGRPRRVVGSVAHEDAFTEHPLYPRFTPDGRSLLLAFIRDPSSELPELDVYRMDLASGRIGLVFERASIFLYRAAAAAPVFVTGRGRQLVVVDASSGEVRDLGRPEGSDYALDPPGRRLAYSVPDGGDGDASLWVREIDGGGTRRVARDAAWPAWSRDGGRIAFFRDGAPHGSPAPLLVVPASGGEPVQLADDALVGRAIWTDDEVLFLRKPDEGTNGTEYDVGDLYAADASGSGARAIGEALLPLDVLPGGQRLLFLRLHVVEDDYVFTVRTMSLDGGEERVHAVIDEEDVNIGSIPSWLPVPLKAARAVGRFAPTGSATCEKRLAELRDTLAAEP